MSAFHFFDSNIPSAPPVSRLLMARAPLKRRASNANTHEQNRSQRLQSSHRPAMKAVPCIPESAPFTAEQRAWINGYLAGLFSSGNGAGDAAVAAAPSNAEPAKSLLILYGSQTGTAEAFAKRIAKEAEKRHFTPRVLEANAFASVDWKAEQRLLLVTSTWGDGDPPDNATALWAHLSSDAAPRLEQLSFSVLALGDKNYSDFCGAGRKFDERFAALGARRVLPRSDCDTDYEATATAWMEGLWPALAEGKSVTSEPVISNGVESAPALLAGGSLTTGSLITDVLTYSRVRPFPARLVTNRRLNATGSVKDTRHFEIALDGSGLSYEAGDALGVMPMNDPQLVGELLNALGCDGEEAVKDAGERETSLRHALLHSFHITQPSPSFLKAVAERSGDATLGALLDPAKKVELDKFIYGREIVDFLLGWPAAKFSPLEFTALLRKLQPRLYSISSSPKANPGQVHLTVATVRYESHGRARKGVCSTFLADRVEAETPVPVFVQASHGFRLPSDGTRPVIMIGPGTGIAPFRAFLQERQALGSAGRNWLFFGDQRRDCDFLYREEVEALLAAGTLSKLDTAFSRDQAEKIYVQNRMLEHAGEFWSWLEDGAHLYVCGDAKRMAKDVDAALHEIAGTAGGRSKQQAAEYVQKLKTEKRYQRDVY
jgi:sulfite reductase (NADPH) flavoprotein alpha-component